MRPIKLTKRQKERLIEMCIALFPKLQEKCIKNAVSHNCVIGFYLTGDNHLQCSYPIDSRDDSFHKHLIDSIHWFEFVYLYLVKLLRDQAIANGCIVDNITSIQYKMLTGNMSHLNPIDGLYEQLFSVYKKYLKK